MPQSSINLQLALDQVPDDDSLPTGTWINSQSGYSSTSNMQKIDAFAGEIRNSITDLKGAGYTNQTVRGNYDLIQSTNQKITYTTTVTGTNTLVGTIIELTSIQNNLNIFIIPSVTNTSSVTLNINSTGALPIVKVQNWTGSTVYAPLEAGDLTPNTPILIKKSNDGLRYIYIDAENFARHIYFENSTNNFTNLQSKLTTMAGDIANKANLSGATFTGNINVTTINSKNPSFAVIPSEVVVTTGFSSGWSGEVRYRINQEGQRTVGIVAERTSDILTSAETVITIPAIASSYSFGYGELSSLWSATFASRVVGAAAEIKVDGNGSIRVASIGSVTATARAINGFVMSYY